MAFTVTCPCGQPLPIHLREHLTAHVCSCERRYVVQNGQFTSDGTEPNPFTHLHIPPEQWGRDHFTTLLYLETRVVDHDGKLSDPHMRQKYSGYPCQLRDGELPNHGDYECLEDMRTAGLIDHGEGQGEVHRYELTVAGWRLAHFLRMRRGQGLPGLPPAGLVLDKIAGRDASRVVAWVDYSQQVDCPRCHVNAGMDCRTPAGRKTITHGERNLLGARQANQVKAK